MHGTKSTSPCLPHPTGHWVAFRASCIFSPSFTSPCGSMFVVAMHKLNLKNPSSVNWFTLGKVPTFNPLHSLPFAYCLYSDFLSTLNLRTTTRMGTRTVADSIKS
ncbi:hypothetical protein ABKN59_004942 [Abortiporus biennis]